MAASAAPMMQNPAGYGATMAPPAVAVVAEPEAVKGESLTTLRKWFDSYQDTKTEEMAEQQLARRYYHSAQWTDEEKRELERRGQPVVTINRIALKIDGIVGVIERLRQDPKAQARTKAHEAGAFIGTSAVREICDANEWETLSSEVSFDLAVDGIGGIERDIEMDTDGQPNIVKRRVAPETFFYDPRSVKPDFSDARYMGVYKWMDLDAAIEMLPDQEEELRTSIDASATSSVGLQDWDRIWFNTRLSRVKIVEVWYKMRGDWMYAVHTGDRILVEGVSPYKDKRGKTRCRYNMASGNIDQNGNRYGFFRNMQSPQDEVNHRRSKLLHILNSQQVIYEDGAVDDINDAKRELAKPNGAVKVNPGQQRFEIRSQQAEMQGQAELLQESKGEIDNFGPTPALLGAGPGSASGRAQAMQQQAGIAQLGPYFRRFKGWKIRVYRDDWLDVQQFWTAPRSIRVAGEDEFQFIDVNQMVMTAEGPRIANAIGELDLDIVMDEGPDTVTLNEDTMQVIDSMIQKGLIAGPGALPVVAEVMNLAPSVKAALLKANQPPQPDPQAQQLQQAAQQLEMRAAAGKIALTEAQVGKTQAETERAHADAGHKVAQAQNADSLADEHAVHTARTISDIAHTHAKTREIGVRTAQAAMTPLGMPANDPQGQF